MIKTWFVLPDGKLDEVVLHTINLTVAAAVANQVQAKYFFRISQHHHKDMTNDWSIYNAHKFWRADPGKNPTEPEKVIRSATIDAPHMWCIMRRANK